MSSENGKVIKKNIKGIHLFFKIRLNTLKLKMYMKIEFFRKSKTSHKPGDNFTTHIMRKD